MIVVHLHPVVILYPDFLGIFSVQPERLDPSGKREHEEVVGISGMYVPFPVRCQIVDEK